MNEENDILKETNISDDQITDEAVMEEPLIIEEVDEVNNIDEETQENFFKRNQHVLAGIGLAGAGFGGGFFTNYFIEKKKKQDILEVLSKGLSAALAVQHSQMNEERAEVYGVEDETKFIINNIDELYVFISQELMKKSKLNKKQKEEARKLLSALVELTATVRTKEIINDKEIIIEE